MKKKLAEKIALYMCETGTDNTYYGTWSFEYKKIEELFNVKLNDKAINEITSALYQREEVLDVWGPKETGDNEFNVNFGTAYYDTSGDNSVDPNEYDEDAYWESRLKRYGRYVPVDALSFK